MTFRPDSPLNRLILLWPGVPIAACALGYVLATIEISRTRESSFAALAIAMGCGLALSLGLLFHTFFIAWLEVTVRPEGIGFRPIGFAWLGRQPKLVPWSLIQATREVVTRDGGHLTIAATTEVFQVPRALFREDTYVELVRALSRADLTSGDQPSSSIRAAA
ncbi:MAG: hypothetical protein E6J01_09045 [Chloroflexi bacterium]|nr:MAG: hypothetical protein E6J01_09045 [Chloroflexota bacterium]